VGRKKWKAPRPRYKDGILAEYARHVTSASAVGYESVSATVSSVVSGILVILFAAWELMTDRDFINWWHDRWHHPVA